MKKLLLVLLFVPLVSFGQIIIEKKNKEIPKIDLSKIKKEVISVTGTAFPYKAYPFKVFFSGNISKNGKRDKGFKVKKKSKIFDGKNEIKFGSQSDLIAFFEKWGYLYEGSTTTAQTIMAGNIPVTVNVTTLTFRNKSLEPSDSTNKKENAANEIKKLKELFDLGIITEEEYNKKASSLKKILLDN